MEEENKTDRSRSFAFVQIYMDAKQNTLKHLFRSCTGPGR